jgi:hypothetical protein
MGLRCSLAGHNWGESEIERDRDEQGSEVVLTVREYEVCARCGERNLISENTEVTTLATDDDGDDDPAGRAPEPTRDADDESADAAAATDGHDGEPVFGDASDEDESVTADETADASTGDAAPPAEAGAAEIIGDDADAPPAENEPAADDADVDAPAPNEADADADSPAGDDAVFIDDAEDEDVAAVEDAVAEAEEPVGDAAPDPHGEAAPGATGGTEATAGTEASGGTEAADDDGVILDDDAEDDVDDDRDHGEWPDGPDGAGERASADAAATPAENATDAAGSEASGDATAGQLREEPAADDEGYDAEFIDEDERASAESVESTTGDSGGVSPSGIKSAGSTAPPGQRHQRTGELVCPNCQNAESAERTSLRAGDICPECRKGYLSDSGE